MVKYLYILIVSIFIGFYTWQLTPETYFSDSEHPAFVIDSAQTAYAENADKPTSIKDFTSTFSNEDEEDDEPVEYSNDIALGVLYYIIGYVIDLYQ